jgi:hypothetical protein
LAEDRIPRATRVLTTTGFLHAPRSTRVLSDPMAQITATLPNDLPIPPSRANPDGTVTYVVVELGVVTQLHSRPVCIVYWRAPLFSLHDITYNHRLAGIFQASFRTAEEIGIAIARNQVTTRGTGGLAIRNRTLDLFPGTDRYDRSIPMVYPLEEIGSSEEDII